MLEEGAPTPQLQQWLDRLAPVVEHARSVLRRLNSSEIARRSGCQRIGQNEYQLDYLWQTYRVSADDFTVRQAGTGQIPSAFVTSLLLTYLALADGSPATGKWIGFRDLPSGLFYAQAFQGYSGGRLVRELAGGIAAFRCAAGRLGGHSLELGGAGYVFPVLPRVPLALIYWEGDDDFPSQAQVLFDGSAPHYMTTDGLAVLGSQLVDQMLKTAGD